MGLKDFKQELVEEVQAFTSKNFTHEITKTKLVPDLNDPAVTFPNTATMTQKSKLLESAVLFVDMRGSTAMSMKYQDGTTLAPVYSAFVRAMSKCAHRYDGKVRNIIGDRVMVVFDRDNCCRNALNTAILMTSVVQYVLNPQISLVKVKAGIGIDFGKMLVTKTGVIKQGDENDPNKALVWLGKPANVASKLTDVANKTNGVSEKKVFEGHYYDALEESGWYTFSTGDFLDRIVGSGGTITHQADTFETFYTFHTKPSENPPILFTKYFYDQYVKEHPNQSDIKNKRWKNQNIKVSGYSNKIMGGDVFFTDIKD